MSSIIKEIMAGNRLSYITWKAKHKMLIRKHKYKRKQFLIRALVALFVLLAFIAVMIFVATKQKPTPVVTAEVTERPHVTLQPVEPQIRPHVTLEPVEPGYIPDVDHYYIPWADRLKISLDEFKLLCRTVQCEVGNQDLKCKKHAARAILNRLYSEKFPNTMHDVVYQRDAYGNPQFSVIDWSGFPDAYDYDDDTETACFLAIAEDDIPSDMFYFNSIGYFTWAIDYWDNGVMFFSRG